MGDGVGRRRCGGLGVTFLRRRLGFGASFDGCLGVSVGGSLVASFFAAGLLCGGWAAGGVSESARMRSMPAAAKPARIDMGRRSFISGVIPVRPLAFPDASACACLIACSASISAAVGPARIGPDEIADQHEIRAGGGEFGRPPRARRQSRRRAARTIRPTIAGARRSPPTEGRCPLRVGFAEQHVIRAELARGHRIVPRRQPADAGDAVGLQRRQGFLHRRDAGQMRAIGAGARDQLDMAIEQQRRARRPGSPAPAP